MRQNLFILTTYSGMLGDLIELRPEGYYCAQADLYIDPMRSVKRALVTHAHSDHARGGMEHYLAHKDSEWVLRLRLGKNISLQTLEYGESIWMNGVEITLFPAGHVPGSAQVRLRNSKECWVISGDYKTIGDGLTPAFESVVCDYFITESTFGLPVYQWKPQAEIFREINAWWQGCAEEGLNAVMSCYSLGKAQRVLKYLDRAIGRVICHGSIAETNEALERQGFDFGSWERGETKAKGKKRGEGIVEAQKVKGALIVCPPAAMDSQWMKQFGEYETGSCSGWMGLRGTRRWGNLDRGFVLSDHADWNQLLGAVESCGAENVYVTHGFSEIFARYLREERGLRAQTTRALMRGDFQVAAIEKGEDG